MNAKKEEASEGVLIPMPTALEVGRRFRLADFRTTLSVIPREEEEGTNRIEEEGRMMIITPSLMQVETTEAEVEEEATDDPRSHWKVD